MNSSSWKGASGGLNVVHLEFEKHVRTVTSYLVEEYKQCNENNTNRAQKTQCNWTGLTVLWREKSFAIPSHLSLHLTLIPCYHVTLSQFLYILISDISSMNYIEQKRYFLLGIECYCHIELS